MGKPDAFLSQGRRVPAHRPVASRVHDWQELYEPFSRPEASEQASRCMSCGIPYCHAACPLGNLISDWNDLAYRGRWRDAAERLHATNNFPELTGRLCPELCEAACALSINDEPVTNAVVEKQIAEVAWSEGWVVPQRPSARTGKKVAVVGSGRPVWPPPNNWRGPVTVSRSMSGPAGREGSCATASLTSNWRNGS